MLIFIEIKEENYMDNLSPKSTSTSTSNQLLYNQDLSIVCDNATPVIGASDMPGISVCCDTETEPKSISIQSRICRVQDMAQTGPNNMQDLMQAIQACDQLKIKTLLENKNWIILLQDVEKTNILIELLKHSDLYALTEDYILKNDFIYTGDYKTFQSLYDQLQKKCYIDMMRLLKMQINMISFRQTMQTTLSWFMSHAIRHNQLQYLIPCIKNMSIKKYSLPIQLQVSLDYSA